MFGKEKKSNALSAAPIPKIETIIGPNAYFQGDIQADGGVRIDVKLGSIDRNRFWPARSIQALQFHLDTLDSSQSIVFPQKFHRHGETP